MSNSEARYKEFIEQIKREPEVDKKVDSLATMVFTMATNDYEENRKEHRSIRREFKKMKKVMIMLIILTGLLLLANPKVIALALILKGLIF